MRITILEFAPCADAIYHLRRDAEEGYIAGDGREVMIRSGSKLRPHAVSTYAGGKATNVARVIEKLLNAEDKVDIELVVFRPDSPEGRYIHDLQTGALKRVRVLPVIIEGTARLCIDLTDPVTAADNRVEFNISPRALWGPDALDAAFAFVSGITTDLLVLAGNPPLVEPARQMAVDLYARIIEQLYPHAQAVSVDAEKGALAMCLKARRHPNVIKINRDEYLSVNGDLWKDFRGTLITTDAGGCWVAAPDQAPARVPRLEVPKLYSTIGAGDAMHAGFILSRWVWGFTPLEASRYGQASAAATVSSPEGTRGITKQAVERLFAGRKEN